MEAHLPLGAYRLSRPLLGILNDGERGSITVPNRAEITVLSMHDGVPLVDVRWDDREFVMFAVDLRRYAERIKDGHGA